MHVQLFRVVRCRWTVEKLDVVIDLIRDVQYAQKSHNAYLNFLVKMKNKKTRVNLSYIMFPSDINGYMYVLFLEFNLRNVPKSHNGIQSHGCTESNYEIWSLAKMVVFWFHKSRSNHLYVDRNN